MTSDVPWIAEHTKAWDTKPGLRSWYTEELYRRVLGDMVPGTSLEIGTGCGFFADYFSAQRSDWLVTTDLTTQPGVAVAADVHALPFPGALFSNVVMIHVLHHFARPAIALNEAARVLRPGGRVLLIEPWTGLVGGLFYKYAHHEDFRPVDDPWHSAMGTGKSAMDGNTVIGREIFVRRRDELGKHVPQLALLRSETFSCLSYIATGGFRNWGATRSVVQAIRRFESLWPQAVRPTLCLQAYYLLERRLAESKDEGARV